MPDEKEVMHQGSTYNESNPEVMSEGMSQKIPKKVLYIVAGSAVLLILMLVGYSIFGPKESSGDPAVNTAEISQGTTAGNGIDLSGLDVAGNFTDEDKKNLRASGYTGDEIEKFQSEGKTIDELTAEAKKEKEEYLQKLYVELSTKVNNPASAEFKQLRSMTWLSGNVATVPPKDVSYQVESLKENVDYIRIPARGVQLFLRLTLNDGNYAFMEVSPERYAQLRDSGNIVIAYDCLIYPNGKFVSNIREVEV